MAITDQVNQTGKVISQDFNPILQGTPVLGSYKRGGKARKTGVYKLHKDEKVLAPVSNLRRAK